MDDARKAMDNLNKSMNSVNNLISFVHFKRGYFMSSKTPTTRTIKRQFMTDYGCRNNKGLAITLLNSEAISSRIHKKFVGQINKRFIRKAVQSESVPKQRHQQYLPLQAEEPRKCAITREATKKPSPLNASLANMRLQHHKGPAHIQPITPALHRIRSPHGLGFHFNAMSFNENRTESEVVVHSITQSIFQSPRHPMIKRRRRRIALDLSDVRSIRSPNKISFLNNIKSSNTFIIN